MKCEGYGHIQAEYANTWCDDDFEACNEGENIYNESVAPVSLSKAEQCSSDLTIFSFGPPVDSSTYESLSFMTALAPSDVATHDAKADVESDDDEEISDHIRSASQGVPPS